MKKKKNRKVTKILYIFVTFFLEIVVSLAFARKSFLAFYLAKVLSTA